MTATFDKDTHPELLDVPLKGDMLAEFVHRGRDRLMMAMATKAEQPENQALLDIACEQVKKIIHDVSGDLEGEGIKKFGLTMNELSDRIYKETGVNPVLADSASTMQAAEQTGNDEAMVAAVKEGFAQYMMADFSMCLALQEGREKDYIAMAKADYRQQRQDALEETYNHAGGKENLGEDQLAYISTRIGVGYVYTLGQLHERRQLKRNPRMLEFEEKIVFGEDWKHGRAGGIRQEFLEALADINGLDTRQSADREALRRMEAASIAQASHMAGVTLPKLPARV